MGQLLFVQEIASEQEKEDGFSMFRLLERWEWQNFIKGHLVLMKSKN